MAKSKKKRQQDFQKVKLKVGKKLKKADNVTNTSFRTRAIQITQQLKTGDVSQPTTKKKQNITDLFTQCRHYSASVRLDSINGLRELLTANSDLVNTYLSDLLEKIAELFTDKDSVVRKGAIKLLKIVLPVVSEKQMSPFFPLLCAHLCCAMTHIFDDIQVDSLSVLDLLLENYPKLMIFKSSQVLTNFIEQISRQQGQGQAKRSISTNPNSTTSSLKWRNSVLNRLQKFLSATLEFCGKNCELAQKNKDNVDMTLTSKEMTFSPDEIMSVQLFPRHISHQWEMPGITHGGNLSKQMDATDDILSGKFPEFADTLLPLMLECWVESAPSKMDKSSAGGGLIQGENVAMMYSVLQVTETLWECICALSNQESVGVVSFGKYLKDFELHFMANFPYSVNSRVSTKDKKSKPEGLQVTADMLNLTICDIMTNFIGGPVASQSQSYNPGWLPVVVQYVNDFLSGKYGRASVGQSARTVVKILSRLTDGGYIDDTLVDLITTVYRRFEAANVAATEKRVYLEYLADSVLSDRLNILSSDLRKRFLQGLPELLPLCATDSPQMASLIIKAMKMAACQKCEEIFTRELFTGVGRKWFDVNGGVIVSLPEPDQRSLIDLLYRSPYMDRDLATTLCNLSRSPVLASQQVCYLIQVLQNRYLQSVQTAEEVAVHIGFLTSLVMGISSEEYDRIMREHCSTEVSAMGSYTVCNREWLDAGQPADVDRSALIVERISGVTQQFPNTDQVLQLMFRCMEKKLKQFTGIPLPVVFRLCKFAESLFAVPNEFTAFVNDLSISLVSDLVTCEHSANQSIVEYLLNLGSSLLFKSKNGLESVFIAAAKCLNKQGCRAENMAMTLKVVMMFLNDRGQQILKGDPHCRQSLSTLSDVFKLQADKYQGMLTTETEKLLTQYSYLISCVL